MRQLQDASPRAYNAALRTLTERRNWIGACILLWNMRSWQPPPDIVNYTMALSACAKGVAWHVALMIHEQATLDTERGGAGLVPDARSFSATMQGCARVWQWKRAVQLLQEMGLQRVQANVVNCSVAISACERANQWTVALDLLRTIERTSLQPDAIVWSAGISACEKAQRWEHALRLLNHMHPLRLKAGVVSFSAAMSACEKGHQWRHVLTLLSDMSAASVTPNVVSFSAAVTACEKAALWERALAVTFEVLHSSVQPDVALCTSSIAACDAGSHWSAALAILTNMCTWEVKPNVNSCNSALSACARSREWEQAAWFFQSSLVRRTSPDAVGKSCVVASAGASLCWDVALLLLGADTNAKSLYEIQQACLENHQQTWAAKVLCKLVQSTRRTLLSSTCCDRQRSERRSHMLCEEFLRSLGLQGRLGSARGAARGLPQLEFDSTLQVRDCVEGNASRPRTLFTEEGAQCTIWPREHGPG